MRIPLNPQIHLSAYYLKSYKILSHKCISQEITKNNNSNAYIHFYCVIHNLILLRKPHHTRPEEDSPSCDLFGYCSYFYRLWKVVILILPKFWWFIKNSWESFARPRVASVVLINIYTHSYKHSYLHIGMYVVILHCVCIYVRSGKL